LSICNSKAVARKLHSGFPLSSSWFSLPR
jgi:hypothetical protein